MSDEDSAVKKPSVWNYVFLALAGGDLLFYVLPKIADGTLENRHYIGTVFLIGVIGLCIKNITKK